MTHNITIDIEQLVLHGFERSERLLIRAAVKRELARLVGAYGWPSEVREARRIDGGAFEVAPGMAGDEIGARIASAVYVSCGGQSE